TGYHGRSSAAVANSARWTGKPHSDSAVKEWDNVSTTYRGSRNTYHVRSITHHRGANMERAFDPILVEVMKNELAAISEEMAIAVCKTGRSAMVRIGDFAAAISDGQGRLLGPGYAAPFQIGNFIELMPYVLKKYGGTFKPGDVVVVNDPYAG